MAIPKINKSDSEDIKYFMNQLLVYLKIFRNHFEFHGNISQSSIYYQSNNIFDTNNENGNSTFRDFEFYLDYNIFNIITIKEWLNNKTKKLKTGSK